MTDDAATTDEQAPAPVNFEDALAELETLVEEMEGGELTLEQSLAAFERGVRLTRNCQKALAEAEQRVRVLLEREDGSLELTDADTDATDSA